MTDTARRLLAHAAAKFGGEEKLAEALGISSIRLKAYIRGVHPIPGPLFLQAVDLVMGEEAPLPNPPAGQSPRETKPGQ
jgi:hypothetical protein